MKKLLFVLCLSMALCIGFSDTGFSRCEPKGPDQFECNSLDPNPDPDGIQESANNNGVQVHVLEDGNINTNNFSAITVGNGQNHIDINSASVIGNSRAINVGTEADEIIVDKAHLEGSGSIIFLDAGNDNLTVTDSTIVTTVGGVTIAVGDGNDTAVITGTTIMSGPGISRSFTGGPGMEDVTIMHTTITNTSEDVTVSLGVDDDKVFVSFSTITNITNDFPLRGAAGDDELTIGTEAIIPGGIDCDFGDMAEGFDTLIFAMDVPRNEIAALTEQIENLPTPDGSITINNIFYEYRNCDVIEADLGTAEPIPALSARGLIIMGVLFGIAGFIMAARWRKNTASK